MFSGVYLYRSVVSMGMGFDASSVEGVDIRLKSQVEYDRC